MIRKFFIATLSMLIFSSQLPGTIEDTLRFARGHQEFHDLFFKQNEQEFIRLIKQGQKPQTLFITCSDSRIVPDLVLGTKPGDLFVIRTAGNFVPPLISSYAGDGVAATIQYAVEALGVKHIIVCGHSHCGAIEGLFKELDNQKFGILKKWLRFGRDAKELTLQTIKPQTPEQEVYKIAEQVSVIFQLEHLMTYPFVKASVDNKTLNLYGWYYKIETGEISYYDPTSYSFKSIQTLLKNEPNQALKEENKESRQRVGEPIPIHR